MEKAKKIQPPPPPLSTCFRRFTLAKKFFFHSQSTVIFLPQIICHFFSSCLLVNCICILYCLRKFHSTKSLKKTQDYKMRPAMPTCLILNPSFIFTPPPADYTFYSSRRSLYCCIPDPAQQLIPTPTTMTSAAMNPVRRIANWILKHHQLNAITDQELLELIDFGLAELNKVSQIVFSFL